MINKKSTVTVFDRYYLVHRSSTYIFLLHGAIANVVKLRIKA